MSENEEKIVFMEIFGIQKGKMDRNGDILLGDENCCPEIESLQIVAGACKHERVIVDLEPSYRNGKIDSVSITKNDYAKLQKLISEGGKTHECF